MAAREAGVAAGLAAAEAILDTFDASVKLELHLADGERLKPGARLGTLTGPLAGILAAERTLLNVLGRLSGVATLTKQYVDAVAGTKAVVCETRKTTPGMRSLEKYAVKCGGGTLHRLGLHDAVLFKDNHLAHVPPEKLGEVLACAIRRAKSEHELRFAEVEVDSMEQLRQVLTIDSGLVDMVLLDNMSMEDMTRAVEMRDKDVPGILLEASGGVTIETVRAIAVTGVDRISVGALTHSVRCLDLGLDIG